MKRGFVKRGRGGKPRNYYRSGLSIDDLRRGIEGLGPLSITQVAAILSPMVPPESKRRVWEMCDKTTTKKVLPLDEILFRGMRRIVQLKMFKLVSDGRVRKHGIGKEAKYEWSSGEVGRVEKDSA